MVPAQTAVAPDTSERPESLSPSRRTVLDRVLRNWPEKAAVLAGTAAVALQASRLGRWIVDDAGVTFAYARSVATGHGPVQQPGATPVEGYSDPSWLALLVIGRWLGVFDHGSWFGIADVVLYPKLLALACVFGMLVAVNLAARAVLPRRAWAVTALVGGLFAVNMSLVAWCFSGLENPLYGLTLAALASLMVCATASGTLTTRRTASCAGLLALLAALTRPDGLIYLAVFPVTVVFLTERTRWRESVKAVAISCLTFAVPFGAFLLWRHAEFGGWVSNTAVAKSQSTPTVLDLNHGQDLLHFIGWPAALVCTACIGMACGLGERQRRALVPVLVPLGLAIVAFAVLIPDWMPLYRFATPVWVLGSFALALSVVSLWECSRIRMRGVIACALALSLAFGYLADRKQFHRFLRYPTVPLCEVVAIDGPPFNQYARILRVTDGSLLTPDLGGTLLTSDLRVYDLAGLTDPAIADDYEHGKPAALRTYVFTVARPTFIHVAGSWIDTSGLRSSVLLANGYLPLDNDGGASGNWVRAADVTDPGLLAQARALTASTILPAETWQQDHGRSGCGATLSPGLTLP
ncbi:hypothetical protein [Actinospica robiniae]|uniref:hypothetical protein n=1 Tax=Actinospica robiniae TaxID=304901 RepID=UPI0003F805A9|nr:hypothetical protein [Actinospica robiniae]